MMAEAELSPQARRDLLAIWVYMGERSVNAADRLIGRIRADCERLAEFPYLGREREDLLPGLRGWPIDRYVIFYRVREGAVKVERVLHSAQEAEARFPVGEDE